MELVRKIIKELQDDKVIIAQILGAVVLTVLGYNNMQPQEVTTWASVGQLIVGVLNNPYLLILCILNAWSALRTPKTKEEIVNE